MTIKSLKLNRIHIPLSQPFVTAIRTATAVEAVRVILCDKDGVTGYGEAPASALVTGETSASIEEAIRVYIKPSIIGQPLDSDIGHLIQTSLHGNTSAKAAVEMAWQDLRAQKLKTPLYKLLGGHKNILANDITISIGALDRMTQNALNAIADGFSILKIKAGSNPETDAEQIKRLWNNIKMQTNQQALPIAFRIDANQGWDPRQAIRIIQVWEAEGVPIDLIEQPVPAWDIEGLAMVQSHTGLLIAADESVFSPRDVLRCIQQRAVSVINIKLMKTGGIGSALDICALCRTYGLECMIGCMMESEISAAAAAHLAAAQSVVTRVDIDSPLLCSHGYYKGGPEFCGPAITLSDSPGIGTRPIAV